MKSELDIPMPEIPGYVPPRESEKPKSENETSAVSPCPQETTMYNESLRHRASHANLYQLPAWQQNTYTVNMMCAPNPHAPASQVFPNNAGPQIFPNNAMLNNMQLPHHSQVPLNSPVVPSSPPQLSQDFPLQYPFHPQPSFPPPQHLPTVNNQPTFIQAPPPPQKSMAVARVDQYRPGYVGRNWMDAQWLQPEVPKDGGFALIGETLLCPLKVTILILQDIFRKNR
jgi:hypothetical protein